MMRQKKSWLPYAVLLALLVVLVETIFTAFENTGLVLRLEVFGIFTSIAVAVAAVYGIHSEKKWAYPALLVIFGFYLLNIVLVFTAAKASSLNTLIIAGASVAGIVLCMEQVAKPQKSQKSASVDDSYEDSKPIDPDAKIIFEDEMLKSEKKGKKRGRKKKGSQ